MRTSGTALLHSSWGSSKKCVDQLRGACIIGQQHQGRACMSDGSMRWNCAGQRYCHGVIAECHDQLIHWMLQSILSSMRCAPLSRLRSKQSLHSHGKDRLCASHHSAFSLTDVREALTSSSPSFAFPCCLEWYSHRRTSCPGLNALPPLAGAPLPLPPLPWPHSQLPCPPPGCQGELLLGPGAGVLRHPRGSE